ncbi:MaoC/PaaZ C-terminal domain-containing protein [Microbacterium ulmi]|uniref:MaoC-like domain-containing protein n=1 Tax=Microbacterium ulmi TaxID=179095 RepID=A0A7Y2LYJ5_9MICO|nr:MaoC/PaaZ C-terminal domain-containing protein [Microbacterium ulmi]NII69829.1 acyl dehydratase [Microbacterium ulmi]NNH03201.1 hypothetical protein [Microbacterium ulmi]
MTAARVVRVGDRIEPAAVTPSREDLVRYASASQDFAPLHYDESYAKSRGFDAVLVHGMLKAGYLGSLVSEWAAPDGVIRRFSVRYLRPDYPDQPLLCRAEVTSVVMDGDSAEVEIALTTENAAGEPTVRGTAVVVFAGARDDLS